MPFTLGHRLSLDGVYSRSCDSGFILIHVSLFSSTIDSPSEPIKQNFIKMIQTQHVPQRRIYAFPETSVVVIKYLT